MRRRRLLALAVLGCVAAAAGGLAAASRPPWSAEELRTIQSLSLAALPPLPPDPSNRVADDPAAAALGEALFFDPRLSANGAVACASCHDPGRQFQDGLPRGRGIAEGGRQTMPIAGSAYFPFMFWDGRKDSQWAQALGPLENPAEHGADRTMVVRLVADAYREEYEALFGAPPALDGLPEHAMPGGPAALAAAWDAIPAPRREEIDRAYSNIGKAIAAFERTIAPQPARFDAFAAALAAGDRTRADSVLSAEERDGLRLFIGEANCATCHNGPLFTDGDFHNLGLPGMDPAADRGRSASVAVVKADPFNCLGPFSDAEPSACGELRFMETASAALVGAFRSPSLRGAALRPPYTHAGQFAALGDLLAHYNDAPAAAFGESELEPLGLSDDQRADLAAFLRTLDPTPADPAPDAVTQAGAGPS